eukprot:CAMPEP_0201700476 /NCGR_PEP_ID=MMETSP0578-20130828/28624_1 /ASSEMBLY_ACC=CAM_ASM_000663 /TAXON_ID=267565 /ORGANISM="Skeletonema grethea, Strain CCMP 1804" /LENGTH=243 /DNA_ID=CAMNT_0048187537 /DNA_START=76 /DNA_END=807 /DNA_ORIENTATION=+
MIANNARIVALLLALVNPSLAFTASSAPASTQKTQLQLSTSDEGSRRSFLTNVVTAAVLPSLVLSNPSSASAFGGFKAFESGPLVYGDDAIMDQKGHGTTASPVQTDLRYGVSNKLADKISSFNRVFAEMGGYFEGTSFEKDVRDLVATTGGPVTFYDSVSGKPLFVAPKGRSVDEFIEESKVHGWPSFRDEEVVWESVRVLRSSGETVSTVGTHLGHNLPDRNGNRYCINLVSIAGNPTSSE